MTAALGSCFVCFFASSRILGEMSMPTTNLVDLAMCWKRRPVPQPKSKMSWFWLSLVLFRAASIFAFCSSEYWASYDGARWS